MSTKISRAAEIGMENPSLWTLYHKTKFQPIDQRLFAFATKMHSMGMNLEDAKT